MFNKRPIHIAIINKNVEILGILLKHPGIDVIAVDEIFIFKKFLSNFISILLVFHLLFEKTFRNCRRQRDQRITLTIYK